MKLVNILYFYRYKISVQNYAKHSHPNLNLLDEEFQ